MTDHGWPEDWNDRMAGVNCVMCAALGRGDNDHWVHVCTGEAAEVHLERRSRLPGYCLVVWRHGHVAEPDDLDPGQAGRYWAEVLAVGRAVRARFGQHRTARAGHEPAEPARGPARRTAHSASRKSSTRAVSSAVACGS